jgi:hypothetical protein
MTVLGDLIIGKSLNTLPTGSLASPLRQASLAIHQPLEGNAAEIHNNQAPVDSKGG